MRHGTRRRRPGIPGRLARALFLGALLTACGDAAGPDTEVGVDLGALFAPATPSEVQAVRAEWAARETAPRDARIEATQSFPLGGAPATLRVLSHGIEGGRHYGAVVVPDGAPPASLPVIVYAHGGDAGVDMVELSLVSFAMGSAAAKAVWVVPSFRSESLRAAGRTFRSEGAPSPWDRDVDDAMALLGASLAATPAADGGRVAVVGFSRGGGVALLMAIRDRRVDRVVEFFGPTDFFDGYARRIVEETLDGRPPDLPGVSALRDQFLDPLREGALTVAQVRRELVRRSAVLFAADLPAVQLHHGTADRVVEVTQAESLIATLRAIGRGAPRDEWYLYPGGGHDPLTLPGSFPRTLAFLGPLLTP